MAITFIFKNLFKQLVLFSELMTFSVEIFVKVLCILLNLPQQADWQVIPTS